MTESVDVSKAQTASNEMCSVMSRAMERRERVLCAAGRLFADNGFHNTGIAQIARESDVLVGQLYRDFASKEDIVIAIVERDMSDFLPDMELSAALHADDRAAIHGWVARFIACDEDKGSTDHRVIAEIFAEASRSPKVAAIVSRIQEGFRCHLLAALEKLAPGDHLAERRRMLAEVILTISAGVFQRRLAYGDSLADDVVAALVDGVQRRIDTLGRA